MGLKISKQNLSFIITKLQSFMSLKTSVGKLRLMLKMWFWLKPCKIIWFFGQIRTNNGEHNVATPMFWLYFWLWLFFWKLVVQKSSEKMLLCQNI